MHKQADPGESVALQNYLQLLKEIDRLLLLLKNATCS